MLSKNKRGYDENAIPQHKRCRQNLADAYLAGQVTAARAASLFTGAEAAGATGVEDLARLGGKNANRSLRRKLLKQHHWPKLYWSKIPCWNPKKQIQEMVEMPFLLPHEVVAKLFEHGGANFVLSRAILEEDRALLRAHAEACEPARDPATILPLGLWSDGVPCNWDRSQSLEIIALTLPSIPGYRFPLFCIKKAFQVKQTTMDSALQVLVWSFQQMAVGLHPNRRHDGSNFHAAKEKFRINLSGQPVPLGLLVQFRGDWKMFKDTLGMPSHNETRGCCWLCNCTPDRVQEFDLHASWRQNYFDQWDFLMRSWEQQRHMSPIWQFPNFNLKVLRLDWLHVVDLGCAQDAAGNILLLLQSKMPGNTMTARIGELYKQILQEYKNQGVSSDRLATLTETMIRKNASSAPKLKAKGAETRKLIPVLVALCYQHLDLTNAVEQAAANCMSTLLECYRALDLQPYDGSVLQQCARRFALLYASLTEHFGDGFSWRVKPKFHLLMHLAQSSTNPKEIWCYRDEDFGGAAAAMVRAKGGWNTPASSAMQVLDKFRAANPLPILQ